MKPIIFESVYDFGFSQEYLTRLSCKFETRSKLFFLKYLQPFFVHKINFIKFKNFFY